MPRRGNATTPKPPSRERYEESHPVFSTRIPREVYDEILLRCEGMDWSFADFVKASIQKLGPKLRKEILRRDEERTALYMQGYKAAKAKYLVTTWCSQCRQPIEVDGDEIKKDAAQKLYSAGWHHRTCPTN